MKKYSIILLIILSACSALRKTDSPVSANQSGSYVKLKLFKGDTLGYVQHNFVDNKQKYIGKDLNTLLNDVEIPIQSYLSMESLNDRSITPNTTFDFYTPNECFTKIVRRERFVDINIEWSTPLPSKSVFDLFLKTNGEWTKAARKYYGKQIIGDIKTFK